MGDGPPRAGREPEFVAVIDQERVTDEVRDIALKYDPLNRGGRNEGFHVTETGELHIEDEQVMEAHQLIARKIPNDAIKIVRLPAERGELVQQYGPNGFRLYELPAPMDDAVVGMLGPNGVGKSTALRILGGLLTPNLGRIDRPPDWDEIVREFRGTGVQTHLERLRDGSVRAAYKPQRIDRLAEQYEGTVEALLRERDQRNLADDFLDRFALGDVAARAVETISGGELQRTAIAATLVGDADIYLIDEPSAYLDVGHRLAVARALEEFTTDAMALVVDHDLIALDLMADNVHVSYGVPGGFGVVSRPLPVRRGINQFLDGYLRDENVRIRPDALDFGGGPDQFDTTTGARLTEFSRVHTGFDSFSLTVEPGDIHRSEVIGVLGRNGLGKTTFARLLAGDLAPDSGEIDANLVVSYKPQYLKPSFEGTVQALFATADASGVADEIREPFDLDPLLERHVHALSGGELQRVSIAFSLAAEADLYVLDEPSAYLDVDQRVSVAAALRRYAKRTGSPLLVIDHDLLVLDAVADRAMLFEGEPGTRGLGRSPTSVHEAMNQFLQDIGVTFRTDPETGRPRANKPGSRKDREQKDAGTYYVTDRPG